MIVSPDGHCRAFDAAAQGTVGGNGVGVVVLKRLDDAIDDGDTIYSVIKGSAVNNDGLSKIGFTAPSIGGQAAVITEALAVAGVDADTVCFIEAHGTGTKLGDPVEIEALTRAFRKTTKRNRFCAVGSLKTNIGHLDAAAGVAGLIKATLSLYHRMVPPSLHFETPNPEIDWANTPFYVNDKLKDLKSEKGFPLRTGVSSFGIGGTNAHMVLEEAPRPEPPGWQREFNLLILSAKTENALEMAVRNLAGHLKRHPGINLSDVAYTLCVGRNAFQHRAFLVCRDVTEAIEKIGSGQGVYRGCITSEQALDVKDPAFHRDTASGLEIMGRLWLEGKRIDWSKLYKDRKFKRVPLPTYPFERHRHWVDPPHKKLQTVKTEENEKPDMTDWFYRPVWVPSVQNVQQQNDTACWLIFADKCGLGGELKVKLKESGQQVTIVYVGEKFTKRSDGTYSINHGDPDDYVALIAELRRLSAVPQRIVHLWSIVPLDRDIGLTAEDLRQNNDLGFYSLLYLAQAIGKLRVVDDIEVAVVSDNMQAVTGDEGLYPEKATLLGPVRTIGLEYPNLSCRSIDIKATALKGGIERLIADQLMPELTGRPVDQVVALRGNQRFIQRFDPVRIEKPAGKKSGLRDQGVYLITGGLGGIGLTLAGHLAEMVQARLVLVGRSFFPVRKDWEDWLAAHDENDGVGRKIRTILALEAKGAEVLVICADVSDLRQMQGVIEMARQRFGPLNGVIHAAGVPDGALIPRRTQDMTESVLAPKITGTLVLDGLLQYAELDFFILCSSLSSVSGAVGQIGYCAANAFQDAFAHVKNTGANCLTVAVNWDAWQEVGMAVDAVSLSNSGLPPKTSRMISHPLFDECVMEKPGHERYVSRLNTNRHWVLDDHRLPDGSAVLPGTVYLELALAAIGSWAESEMIEIREVNFSSPLIVDDREDREVHTHLKKRGAGFEFMIESRKDTGPWQVHAKGIIQRTAANPAEKHDIKAIESRYSGQEIVMSGFSQPGGAEPADLEAEIKNQYGPRWHNLQWIKPDDFQGLALMALPQKFKADLTDYLLHPALLDMGTSFLSMLDPSLAGLPFSYKRLTVRGPLPGKIYSHARLIGTEAQMPRFNITLMDEQGMELVDIEEFTLRRIGNDASAFKPAHNKEKKQHSALTEVMRATLSNGLLPREGIEVFNRILGSREPQILVSKRKLESLPEPYAFSMQVQKDMPREESDKVAASHGEEIQQILAEIWQEFLGIEKIEFGDDFFELGGDSLSGIQVVSAINEQLGISLSVATLFEVPTIAALAKHIREIGEKEAAAFLGEEADTSQGMLTDPLQIRDSNSVREHAFVSPGTEADAVAAENWQTFRNDATGISSPLVRIQIEKKESPFFCVHPVSGTVFCYADLVGTLNSGRPFYALQSSGINKGEQIFTQAMDMAAYYIESIRSVQKEGPYYLGGWSMGGLVAFEMAHQLRKAGQEVALLVMIDAYLPSMVSEIEEQAAQKGDDLFLMINDLENLLGKTIPIKTYEMRQPDKDVRIEYALSKILELGVMPPGTDLAQMRRFFDVLEANCRAMENYRPYPYSGDTLFFSSADKSAIPEDPALGWSEFVSRDHLYIKEIPGNHYTMLRKPNVLALAGELSRHL